MTLLCTSAMQAENVSRNQEMLAMLGLGTVQPAASGKKAAAVDKRFKPPPTGERKSGRMAAAAKVKGRQPKPKKVRASRVESTAVSALPTDPPASGALEL